MQISVKDQRLAHRVWLKNKISHITQEVHLLLMIIKLTICKYIFTLSQNVL